MDAVTIDYDVVLSATYQVPVLYFQVIQLPQGAPGGLDFVYKYLVSQNGKSQLQATGVMGGISMQVW